MRTILSFSNKSQEKKVSTRTILFRIDISSHFIYNKTLSHTEKILAWLEMRNSQMKHKEEKILGIFAIIFGALALLGSWLPIISILSFSLPLLL